jgi:hypothetical protein
LIILDKSEKTNVLEKCVPYGNGLPFYGRKIKEAAAMGLPDAIGNPWPHNIESRRETAGDTAKRPENKGGPAILPLSPPSPSPGTDKPASRSRETCPPGTMVFTL